MFDDVQSRRCVKMRQFVQYTWRQLFLTFSFAVAIPRAWSVKLLYRSHEMVRLVLQCAGPSFSAITATRSHAVQASTRRGVDRI